jgi:hypothetical protein
MPLFIPGWSPRRPDHNARRDKPQPLMARNKGGQKSRRAMQGEFTVFRLRIRRHLSGKASVQFG